MKARDSGPCSLVATRIVVVAVGLVLGGAGTAPAQTPGVQALSASFGAHLERVRDDLIATRRDLHRHPELSGQEERTARIVARRLESLGLDVRTGVGGHGVVGVLRGARPGPTVAFRADMDAVPSTWPDPVEFASETPGVRHVCGHDVHTVIGLALAEGMAAIQDEVAGSVMFVFQPAEENATGARAMLEDGVFATERPVAIFAFHTAPLEAGRIGTRPGALLPGRDRVAVLLSGGEDLEAAAREVAGLIGATSTIDPAVVSSEEDFAVARVGRPGRRAGERVWEVPAIVTTSGPAASARVSEQIRRELVALEERGISSELRYEQGWIAGVQNDAGLEAAARGPLRSAVGEEGLVVLASTPTAFSEDFGSLQEQVPGVMYFLGVSNSERGWIGLPHSPGYVADEEAIFVGARAMAAVLLDVLGRSGG